MSFSGSITEKVITFTGDISPSTYDRCFKDLISLDLKPTGNIFQWPFFKLWFTRQFSHDVGSFDLEKFFETTSYVNKPYMLGKLLEAAIRRYFTQDIVDQGNDRMNMDLYYYLNKELSEIDNVMKVALIKHMWIAMSSNDLNYIADQLTLVGYYLPEMKRLASFFVCSKLEPQSVVDLFKEIGCVSITASVQPEELSAKDVLQKYKKLYAS